MEHDDLMTTPPPERPVDEWRCHNPMCRAVLVRTGTTWHEMTCPKCGSTYSLVNVPDAPKGAPRE